MQSYQFNAFGNLTQRNNRHWDISHNFDLSYTYQNNRITNSGFQYDADGREIVGISGFAATSSTYNAAGQLIKYHRAQGVPEHETKRFYNGNGREEKRSAMNYVEVQPDQWEWQATSLNYYIRSSVLGGEVVSEAYEGGAKRRTFVRAAGSVIAWQNGSGVSENVSFMSSDASGLSHRSSNEQGNFFANENNEGGPAELDPFGGNAGMDNPYIIMSQGEPCEGCLDLTPEMPMYVNGIRVSATIDGMAFPLHLALSSRANGMAVQCPNNDCGPQLFRSRSGQLALSNPFEAYGDGRSGYRIPIWERVDSGFSDEEPSGGAWKIGGWEFVDLGDNSMGRVSWNPPRPRRVTAAEANILVHAIETALKNTDICENYIKDLIEKVASNGGLTKDDIVSTNILELFYGALGSRGGPPDKDWGGIFIDSSGHPTHYARPHRTWVRDPGFVEVHLEYGYAEISGGEFPNVGISDDFAKASKGGIFAIHELMHLAFKKDIGTDPAYAFAAADLAGVSRPELVPGKNISGFWQGYLELACGYDNNYPKPSRLYK